IAALDLFFPRFADVFLNQIPLIDDDDTGFAVLDDGVGDFFVLFQNAGFGVQDQNGDVATRDGVLCALHAEKFHRIVDAAGFAHAGGVDQDVFLPHAIRIHLEWYIDRIARGAGDGTDDDALGLSERVDDRRFTNIRASDDCDFKWADGRGS